MHRLVRPSGLIALPLAFLALTFAAVGQENLIVETTQCKNGTYGELSLIEVSGRLAASQLFIWRVTDCGSTLVRQDVPLGTCSLNSVYSQEPETKPSPTTPVKSSLDAGESVLLKFGGQELKLSRSILGADTSYGVAPRTGAGASPLVSTGQYTVSAEGGRDIPAFTSTFDYQPFVLTRPASGSTLPNQEPLRLEWTGTAGGYLYIDVIVSNGQMGGLIRCRLENGSAGSFSLPESVWRAIPANIRSGANTTINIHGDAGVKLEVPGVEHGFAISIPFFKTALARLAQ